MGSLTIEEMIEAIGSDGRWVRVRQIEPGVMPGVYWLVSTWIPELNAHGPDCRGATLREAVEAAYAEYCSPEISLEDMLG